MVFSRMNINTSNELVQVDQTLRASRYDGYDLVKTGAVGYLLGRVSLSRLSLNTVGGPIKGPAIKGPFPKKMKWAFVP